MFIEQFKINMGILTLFYKNLDINLLLRFYYYGQHNL